MEFPRHLVTAVLVAHDGAPWLPDALAALQWQRRPPQRIAAVDTGSGDDTRAILDRELGPESVLDAPRDMGYGAAVQLALTAYAGAPEPPMPGRSEEAETVDWVWLLHDDCAPAPDALRNLLELADTSPQVAVVGPKIHAWHDPRIILEVGFTVDTSGRRETGLERREFDQGQHDAVRDVLAVSSAGALIRRDVWDALGGFDPALPLFRDDLDFCWRANLAGHRVVVAPQATVRHAAAATARRRPLDATGNRPRRVDRAHALYTLLVNLSALGLIVTIPRLILGSLFRVAVLLLVKRTRDAADELSALGSVLRHPRLISAGRARRSATRQLPHRATRPLMSRRSTRLRHRADAFATWLAERARGEDAGPSPTAIETGPSEGDYDFDVGGTHLFRRIFIRPGPLVVLGLVLVALIAERGLLGGGSLAGGQLLPAPTGARDLWSAFFASWHPVAQGSDTASPPYLAVLATLSTVLFGKAWLAADVILLGCVPLAGVTAYITAGRVTRDPILRAWGAATYALLPIATGVVAAGRLGDAVAFVVIPLLLVAGERVLRTDPRFDGWRHVTTAALLLAVATAFAPVIYLVALPVLIGGTVGVRLMATPPAAGGAIRRTLGIALVAGLPLALLWPWTATVLSHPDLVLQTPGPAAAGLTATELHPAALLVAAPGGPGTPGAWVTVPLLLAGLAGLIRVAGRQLARALWGVGLAALVVGILVAHARMDVNGARIVGWPGIPAAIVGAVLVAGALVAGDGARERLSRMSFSWRQPLAGVVAVGALLVPVVAGVAWLSRGASDPVDRVKLSSVLPAFIAAEANTTTRPRVLILRAAGDGSLSYALLRGSPPRLGDGDVRPSEAADRQLSAAVADLAAGRGGAAAAVLGTYGVRYVLVPSADAAVLGSVLDGSPGLSRVSTAEQLDLWRVTAPSGRLVVLPTPLAQEARTQSAPDPSTLAGNRPLALPADVVGAHATVPAGADGRLLVLAESADNGWRAEIGGQRLERVTAWGWAQGFVLPAAGGQLRVWHSGGRRDLQLLGEGLLLLVVMLAAVPASSAARRPADDGPPPPPSQDGPTEPLRNVRVTAGAPGRGSP
ncbi:MAG: hypothetical protein QOG53_1145 [Frankiales bacterium]|nr:hypothetical protein [Frankiales bacterium]